MPYISSAALAPRASNPSPGPDRRLSCMRSLGWHTLRGAACTCTTCHARVSPPGKGCSSKLTQVLPSGLETRKCYQAHACRTCVTWATRSTLPIPYIWWTIPGSRPARWGCDSDHLMQSCPACPVFGVFWLVGPASPALGQLCPALTVAWRLSGPDHLTWSCLPSLSQPARRR